jgi:hypothetical protein
LTCPLQTSLRNSAVALAGAAREALRMVDVFEAMLRGPGAISGPRSALLEFDPNSQDLLASLSPDLAWGPVSML